MTVQLEPLDRVEVTVLLDNSIDVFLASTEEVRRAKVSTKEPWGERPALIAEHGFSVMVTAHARGETRRMLFDAGMTTHGLAHNLATLGLGLKDFECLVLSHDLGDQFNVAIHLNNLGTVFHHLEQYPEARSFYQQSLNICRQIGDQSGLHWD